jgi:hypothetical protein
MADDGAAVPTFTDADLDRLVADPFVGDAVLFSDLKRVARQLKAFPQFDHARLFCEITRVVWAMYYSAWLRNALREHTPEDFWTVLEDGVNFFDRVQLKNEPDENKRRLRAYRAGIRHRIRLFQLLASEGVDAVDEALDQHQLAAPGIA